VLGAGHAGRRGLTGEAVIVTANQVLAILIRRYDTDEETGRAAVQRAIDSGHFTPTTIDSPERIALAVLNDTECWRVAS
jgi:hypothetical protein